MTSGRGFKRGLDSQRSEAFEDVVERGFSGTPELVAVVLDTATGKPTSLACPETRTSGYDLAVWLMLFTHRYGSNHSPGLVAQLRGFLLGIHAKTLPVKAGPIKANPSAVGELRPS
jgi:hypothetical protein